MSRLFISLYLDEEVSVLIAKLMRARGLFASTTFEVGNGTQRQLAILTHNRADFERLAAEYYTQKHPYR